LGRIVALCDVLDALTTKRPYKDAWSFDRAVLYIESERGRHFDPDLVDLFNEHIQQIRSIYDNTEWKGL
jgi:putative two-component system response regulator